MILTQTRGCGERWSTRCRPRGKPRLAVKGLGVGDNIAELFLALLVHAWPEYTSFRRVFAESRSGGYHLCVRPCGQDHLCSRYLESASGALSDLFRKLGEGAGEGEGVGDAR